VTDANGARFQLDAVDGRARTGRLVLPRGVVETPVFMPVGTAGTVKGVSPEELEGAGATMLLANTYHLYLRPGDEVVESLGGLHDFMRWKGPILTDSGGYQVFSLASTREIGDDGVMFRSHIDGSSHHFSPERVIDIQRRLGADVMMAFDECAPGGVEWRYAARANRRAFLLPSGRQSCRQGRPSAFQPPRVPRWPAASQSPSKPVATLKQGP